jgi:hypothetical protein
MSKFEEIKTNNYESKPNYSKAILCEGCGKEQV